MNATSSAATVGPKRYDVSVVIPVYNRQSLVRYTLESLRQEHHPGVSLQVIVVDDGSTDGGPEVIEREFSWASQLRQERRGAPAARNQGAAHADAQALHLLDSDDLVEPGFYSPRLEALAKHRDAAAVYGPWEMFEGDGAFDPQSLRPRHTQYPVEKNMDAGGHIARLLRGWYILPSTVLWRSDVYRQLGGHDERLRINQDVDFMFRILTETAGIVGTDGPRALGRQHRGPRQGDVTSVDRVAQIVQLRKHFRRVLEDTGKLDDKFRIALAEYSFDGWAAWRGIAPRPSSELLAMSRDLCPSLPVRGGWLLRALGVCVGSANAVIVKQHLDGWRRSSTTRV